MFSKEGKEKKREVPPSFKKENFYSLVRSKSRDRTGRYAMKTVTALRRGAGREFSSRQQRCCGDIYRWPAVAYKHVHVFKLQEAVEN
jgi:hypothetical protein